VFVVAVGNHPLAVDRLLLVPTAENPANNHKMGNAGGAGGIPIAYDGDYWRSGS
jgi:hypothetical protein